MVVQLLMMSASMMTWRDNLELSDVTLVGKRQFGADRIFFAKSKKFSLSFKSHHPKFFYIPQIQMF